MHEESEEVKRRRKEGGREGEEEVYIRTFL